MPRLDLDLVRHALNVARQHGCAEVELEVGEAKFAATLGKQRPRTSSSAVHAASSETPMEEGLTEITAHVVGYFQDGEDALKVGQEVQPGQTVASITALGLANDVESSVGGQVVEVLVQDGDPVQFGQVIAKVKV